jgi:uroporphyrinogen-III decarboxylase
MALILRTDSSEEEVSPASGKTFSLEELQTIVGEGTDEGRGYIEIVPCKDKKHIIVLNEEGKLLGLPINARASELADLPTQADIDRLRKAVGSTLIVVGDDDPLHGPDVIVGTVLVCENREAA